MDQAAGRDLGGEAQLAVQLGAEVELSRLVCGQAQDDGLVRRAGKQLTREVGLADAIGDGGQGRVQIEVPAIVAGFAIVLER